MAALCPVIYRGDCYNMLKLKVQVNMMPEKTDAFFESRLSDYDQHMLTAIEGADEFYPYTAALLPREADTEVLDLGCGTGLELEEYFSPNPNAHVTGIDLAPAMLERLAEKFPNRKPNLICRSYFDTPLTVEHEIELLKKAGFSEIKIIRNGGAAYTLLAKR